MYITWEQGREGGKQGRKAERKEGRKKGKKKEKAGGGRGKILNLFLIFLVVKPMIKQFVNANNSKE